MKRWFHVIERCSDGTNKSWGFAINESLIITDINDEYKQYKNKSTRDPNVRAFFYGKEVIEIKVPTPETYERYNIHE